MTISKPLAHVLAALLCVAGLASAQAAPAKAPADPAAKPAAGKAAAKATSAELPIPDIGYTKFVLKNGLTVLVHEDHKTPVVAVNTWYHVGSKNENPGKTGFAHLFEHLMFSGSDNFNHTYLKAMERIGATALNGTTNNDRTNYFENVPTSMLDYTLFAESDRMGHLLGVLDEPKLNLQRGVVQNEKRQGENQPYRVSEQLLVENTYPVGHPYSWTVIGSMKDLDAASMADVQEWFKTYYGPNNITLVLAGDITPDEARKKVERYYGEIPPGPPIAKHEAWIAKRSGTHRGTVEDRVPQGRLYRVWNVPQFGTRDEALLDLAARVFGGGKASRLYKRLVYRDQTATSANASNDSNEIGGQFDYTITASVGEGNMAHAENAANQEFTRFLKEGPSATELAMAKTQIFAVYARIAERVGGFGGKSDLLARCNTYVGKPDCYKDYLRWIKEATPASVKKAANDWLSDGDYILEVKPYPTDLKAEGKLDRSKPPAEGAAMSLNLPPLQRATLSNGLKLAVVERHAAPVVNLQLIVDSGYASDKLAAPGTASFAMRMLEEGTPTRDSLRIGEELEGLATTFNAGANLDTATVTMSALKANLDPSLKIYADLVLHPAFPQKEFERLQRDRLASIKREKVTPNLMALRVLPGLLYGKDHPYATPLTGTGTEASVAAIRRADLVKFHQAWFKPNNATLLIVGDTSVAEIMPKLEKLFGGWKPGKVPAKEFPVVAQSAKPTVYLIDRPGSGQSNIIAAQLAPARNDPNHIAIDLVNEVFGGSFSSRLNMNLREDKHWSYGVGARLIATRGPGPYYSSSPVQADKTKEALVELMKEYAAIAGGKSISATELTDAQTNNTLGLPGSFETVAQLTGAYSTILTYELPVDYYNTYTQKALSLTPAAASDLARKLVTPDRLTWIVIGDMSKIEAGIRELNIGEVRKIDADGNAVK